jgi:beta-N-acetylhexosaminidase
MTAHVVFTTVDPVLPATTSASMISEVIRGFIGFDGALMSDDVSMGALTGSIAERTRASLAAGCDLVLHCNGAMAEMEQVAAEAPTLSGDAKQRTDAALAARRGGSPLDMAAGRAEFARLMRSEARIS